MESGGTRWEMKPTDGASMAVIGGTKDVTSGMHNPKEKAPFGEYAKAARAEWAARG
jgi:hypothetical protein